MPYRYQTPKGIELDLRLFNKGIRHYLLKVLYILTKSFVMKVCVTCVMIMSEILHVGCYIFILFLDLLDKCSVIVKRILEKEAKGWYIKYKDKLLTELKGKISASWFRGMCTLKVTGTS